MRVVHDWELSQFTIIEFLYLVGVVLGWPIKCFGSLFLRLYYEVSRGVNRSDFSWKTICSMKATLKVAFFVLTQYWHYFMEFMVM